MWSREEQRQYDAFGNPTSVVKTDSLTVGYAERFLLREPTYGGAAHRLQSYGVRNADSTLVAETTQYDAEGNRTRYTTTAADDYFVDVEMMYDAVGQLRYVDRRICKMTAVDAAAGVGDRGCVGDPDQLGSVQDSVFRDQSVFQEYLYDALGRRVLIHSRASDTQCGTSNCPNYVERVVWDGDQILFEARYPSVDLEAAGGGTINADLGKIEGTVDVSDGLHPFGVVGYVHGAQIDKPYIVERQYHNPAAPSEVLYSYAIEDELGAEVIPTDESGDPETQECLDTVDGDCHGIEWELWDPWPSLEKRPVGRVLTEGPSYWMGSLGEDGEDPTGLLYRRNRYYDPLAGQFTQEDPIGLAGGLNVYGFAGSDPVNFSDPFGLSACEGFENTQECVDAAFEGDNSNDGVTVFDDDCFGFWDCFAKFFENQWTGFTTPLDQGPPAGGSLGWALGRAALVSGNSGTHSAALRAGAGALTTAEISGMLRAAAAGKGNFTVGAATAGEAWAMGRAWVGYGAQWSSNGKALISANGLRQFRPPAPKSYLNGGRAANLEWRLRPNGGFQGNAHIIIR